MNRSNGKLNITPKPMDMKQALKMWDALDNEGRQKFLLSLNPDDRRRLKLNVRGLKSRKLADRYIRRFGGRIAYITVMTPTGLFDTLRNKDGQAIAIVGEVNDAE